MKFAVITEMKRNFTLIKSTQLLFVLWCIGVVTNAQNDEPLRKNASTTVVRLRPTAVLGIMNASETAALSQMSFVVKTQTSVPHHHLSVKATRTIINSSMTVIPRTLKGQNETKPRAENSYIDDSSNLGLIIVCTVAVAVVVVVIVVSIKGLRALIHKRRKQSNKRSSNNACRGEFEMSFSQLPVCPPDTAVADVEIPTSSTNIIVGPAAGPTIIGDRVRTIYDEEANISSSSYASGACINLGADKSNDGIGESRKDMSLDDNYDKNRRATMSSGISGVSTNFSTGRSSSFGESCEDLSSMNNYDKNRRATMSSHISRASTRRSSGFSESYEDLSLDNTNRTATMSSCISRASTNFSTGRSSGFGESCEDLSLENNYDKNRRATVSSYISRTSTNLSTRRSSGFWKSCEDLSLDNKNRTATMSSCVSRASTNFSTGRSSGFGESCEDLSSDNNYDKNRRATMSSYPSRASINLSTSGSSGLSASCEDFSLDNSDDMNCKTLPRLSNKEDISLRRAKSYRKARSLSVPASVAKREDWTSMSKLKEHRSKMSGSSKERHPNLVKKSITIGGGVIKKDDIILKIEAGCLAKDTEITLIQDDHNSAFKALLDLGLVDAAPRVVEFLPDGLKFLKPADLTIRFEKTASDSEISILHGSYNCDYQSTVWELVTNAIEDNSAEGVVNMKIYGFCFYSYILAKRGKLARILSHLNHSFTCCAYAFYRRLPSMDTIDISVVMLSEFVDKKEKEDIKQLKDHFEEGYVKGDKGMGKRVHTKRPLEISLDFPGVESIAYPFKVDQPELDKDGFVIDHFKAIAVKSPACGAVKISEVDRSVENEFVWRMNIREEQGNKVEKGQEPKPEPEPEPEREPEVVYRNTQLTNKEISRMSLVIGVDWDSLAGLMDIPYSKREEIRVNHAKYPDFSSKAEEIFALFNCCECFGRHNLEKCVDEIGRDDLKDEMIPLENEVRTVRKEEETQPEEHTNYNVDNVELRNTPLSSREMYRLSKCIVDWDSLAGLMDIAREERNNIRNNTLYHDDRARAEKILSMFNHKNGFTREKLTNCLQGIKRLDLISPIITGKWRKL